ncbi:MAG TPA: glycosyltransferase family 39 protein [Caulobacteraceae bacterium]|nr:glycosyltransferase family 39 protein [Caulobacteraceae bacterium]
MGARSPDAPLVALFAGLAVAACLFAFVGLGRSGYWTDELFTLFVIDHGGGLTGVFRRALTDTHPPAYYFLLYGWSKLFGLSEVPIRLLSALCAVAAAGVFFVSLRRVFSLTARLFALALALNATFWFDQAQNARSYALCMLISALLLAFALAARRQVAAGSRFPAWPCLGLVLAGAFGSFCHSYVFLEVGLIYLFVAFTVPSLRLQIVLVAVGLVVAALTALYARALLHGTQQDVHHMWFRKDPIFFFNQVTVAWRIGFGISGWIAAALLAISAWRRRGGPGAPGPATDERRWVGTLCASVHVGMIVLGIAVSLAVAPSMSSQNLATASPLLWAVVAWLYDVGGPRLDRRAGRIFAAVLALAPLAHLTVLPGRFLNRNEDWRGSARYVAGMPACAGQPIAIALPRNFGPPTPFFRTLAEQSLYGRYFPQGGRLHAYLPDELAGRRPAPGLAAFLAVRAQGAGCPILLWAVHDLPPEDAEALRADLQRLPGVAPARVEMKPFGNFSHEELGYSPWAAAFVYVAAPPPSTSPR